MFRVRIYNEDDILVDTDFFDTREDAELYLSLGFTGENIGSYDIDEIYISMY